MKKIDNTTFLIERQGELEQVVIDYFKGEADAGLIRGHVAGIPSWYSVYYLEVPTEYPFVALLNDDDERCNIEFQYVKPSDFICIDDGSQRLFEFQLRRSMTSSPYRVVESTYQIPAKDIFEAHLKLGQTMHRSEEYELEVVSYQQVR